MTETLTCSADDCERLAVETLFLRDQPGHVHDCAEHAHDVREWVSDVYDQLSMKIPTGPLVGRTRAHAERLGYLPPLMWDNIDDPGEHPRVGTNHRRKTDVDHGNVERAMAGDKIRLTKAERFEIVRRMRAQGWSLVRIEKHTGLSKAERYVEREAVA